jgi:hypothetical protein
MTARSGTTPTPSLFAYDTTVVGLITDNDETAYRRIDPFSGIIFVNIR